MVAQLCKYAQHFKWVNIVACELYLNKAVLRKKAQKNVI